MSEDDAAFDAYPDWFPGVYKKLLRNDLLSQIPGQAVEKLEVLGDDEVRRLIGWASVLSLQENDVDRGVAYEVATLSLIHI